MVRLALALVVFGSFGGAACTRPGPPATHGTDVPPATPAEASTRRLPDKGDHPAVAVGTHGAVTSAEGQASLAGQAILQSGGNAIDAAVAVGFALAVTHPSAGNLGGGGFMVVRMDDGTTAAIDYRERAPGKASRDMYIGKDGNPTDDRLVGPKAAGIPGSVAGLALAHAKFGALPWKDVVMPAVELAEKGHVLDDWHAKDLVNGAKHMRDEGFPASAKHYEKPDGTPFVTGDTWTQPELAKTLRAIAEKGGQAFYEGEIGEALAKGVSAAGGIWTAEDLRAYKAIERTPIVFDYRGHQVITMPPPSAGGVVLRQLLAAAEVLELHEKPWRSVDEVHLYVESARRTYADRNLLLADPDFVDLPMERLLDVSYVRDRLKDIDPMKATPSSAIKAGLAPGKSESHQTTHYSVVDEAGNAVATTTTLNLGFGSFFVVPGTGVLVNNEMDDFAVKPGTANAFGLVQGEQNKIEPGKRMLSSMTPTILVKDGELRAVLGTPGGPTITTTVSQLARAIVDYGMTVDQAVESPRVHHQWLPDMIWAEDRITPELEKGLIERGHQIRKRGSMGHANIIEVDPATKGFRAVADASRDGGRAVAY
jgi:gamma-glutamyltranspeptidase/glutathione hydrolase